MPQSLQSLKSFAQPLLQRVLQPIAPLVRAVQMWLTPTACA